MLDIVTVVFRDELPILRVQAESIDLYCQDIGIQTIFVIVNDDDSIVDQIDPSWWGSLCNRVRIIPRSYFNCGFVENGWVSQQALKMLGSSLSTNQYSMVLDAKTILIQPIKLDQLFDSVQRLCVGIMPIVDVFAPAQQIVNQLFDIELEGVAGPAGVPFYFNNALLNSMIEYLSYKTNQNFAEWFQAQGMLTEFILYTGYVKHHLGDLSLAYDVNYNYGVCNVCHSEVARYDDKLKEMSIPNKLTVSIHRRAWTQLDDKQKTDYRNLLTSRNIKTAGDLK